MTIFERAMINDIEYFKNNLYDINIKNTNGKSLLHYAILGNAFEVVKELLKREIDVNLIDNEGETAFFDCARKAKIELAKLLIINHTNINLSNNKGETPLHLAAAKGDKTMIDLLIENEINLKAKTNNDLFPVHYAVLASNIDIIKYLLNITNQSFLLLDNKGNTLLHFAAKTTNDLLIYFLLSEGLNPNLMNKDFETPLFNASRFGTRETVLALLNNDAYIDIKNNNRETPYDYSVIYEKYQIETLLKNYQMLPKYERLIKRQAVTIATINREYNLLVHLLNNNYPIRYDKYNYSAIDYAKLYNLDDALKILKSK